MHLVQDSDVHIDQEPQGSVFLQPQSSAGEVH